MKVKVEGFVHQNKYRKTYFVNAVDMSEYGYLLVGKTEFEYEIPEDFNPVSAEVDALKRKLENVTSSYYKERKAIESKINDLLCLEAPKGEA